MSFVKVERRPEERKSQPENELTMLLFTFRGKGESFVGEEMKVIDCRESDYDDSKKMS